MSSVNHQVQPILGNSLFIDIRYIQPDDHQKQPLKRIHNPAVDVVLKEALLRIFPGRPKCLLSHDYLKECEFDFRILLLDFATCAASSSFFSTG